MCKKPAILYTIFFLLLACSSSKNSTGGTVIVDWKKISVLVYTKNGKGYVHDNIAAASACVTRLGKQYGFHVDVSNNPADFNDAGLSKYRVLVFNNTNNDVFDNDEQKLALMRYIQAGGGFVGLHSATGTERNWAWFKRLIGASFQRHAKHQPFKEIIIDNTNPSTSFLPTTWEQDDECYFFKEVNPDLHVLMAHALGTLLDDKDKPDFYGSSSPSVWCHAFDGGREWYTSLGHDSTTYSKPDFEKHILGGIEWAAGKNTALDYSKAHAKSPNDPLPY
jgi:type 1 glutamine amidotransferase